MTDGQAELADRGFVWIRDGFRSADRAFAEAGRLVDAPWRDDVGPPLEIIGDFTLRPADGRQSRDFQTLHFDFGLPVEPKRVQDVARYTALHIPLDRAASTAVTLLVPLAELLRQRSWPSTGELTDRLLAYGRSHGAWQDDDGYVEGSLARIVEAAAGTPPDLPSVKTNPDFLCGMEFASLRSERRFFAGHGLRVEQVEIEIGLHPGDLLVFDNLVLAHGRRGIRQPGELRQRVFGHARLAVPAQRDLRDRVLAAFPAGADRQRSQTRAVSIP